MGADCAKLEGDRPRPPKGGVPPMKRVSELRPSSAVDIPTKASPTGESHSSNLHIHEAHKEDEEVDSFHEADDEYEPSASSSSAQVKAAYDVELRAQATCTSPPRDPSPPYTPVMVETVVQNQPGGGGSRIVGPRSRLTQAVQRTLVPIKPDSSPPPEIGVIPASGSETAVSAISTACSEISPPALRLRYKIDSGSFGGVYAASRPDLVSERLAVKVVNLAKTERSMVGLSEEYLARARLLSSERTFFEAYALMFLLRHRNIVRVYSFQVEDTDRAYITMEKATSGTVLDYVRKRGPLAEPRALVWAYQLLSGMAHAHSRGIVHGDIKAENVLMSRATPSERMQYHGEKYRLIIADWGFCKQVEYSGIFMGNTMKRVAGARGNVMSVAYASPEQLLPPQSSSSMETDVWSMGVLFYAMITGRLPFGSLEREEDRHARLGGESPLIAPLPEGLGAPSMRSLILLMLKTSPAQRPSFEQLLRMQAFDSIRGRIARNHVYSESQ